MSESLHFCFMVLPLQFLCFSLWNEIISQLLSPTRPTRQCPIPDPQWGGSGLVRGALLDLSALARRSGSFVVVLNFFTRGYAH